MAVVQSLGMEPLALTIPAQKPVRLAVIPIAGACPGMWPATKLGGPWLFPIRLGGGEAVKPAICWLCEELIAAEIEKIILIVNEVTEAQMIHLFQRREDVAVLDGVPSEVAAYDEELIAMGRRLIFVRQDRPTGIRNALLECEHALGGEPFVLAWGDHLCSSTAPDGQGCVAQLMAGFDGSRSVVGMHCIDHKYVHTAGIVACKQPPTPLPPPLGAREKAFGDSAKCWNITRVCEKPSVHQAEEHLKTPGLPEGQFLGSFGQYVLTPGLFSVLRGNEKIHFTDALDALRQKEGLDGVLIEGCRWDLGNASTYVQALQEQVAVDEAASKRRRRG